MTEPLSRRIETFSGLGLHVLEWGGSNPAFDHTIVLLHGFLDIAWSWQPVVEQGLLDRYHVVAVELRGHGDSDRVGAGGYYHFMDYLADLDGVLDALAKPKLSLVGHSMGGTVASYYAGCFPERVFRLALLEGLGAPVEENAEPERSAAWLTAWKRRKSKSRQTGHANLSDAAQRLRASDPLLPEALALTLAERGTELLPDGSRRFKHDPLHRTRGPYPFRVEVAKSYWRRIRCPVLYVQGGESLYQPLDLEERLACFGSLEKHTLAGAGHMLQRHKPRELALLLTEFLG